MPKRDTPTKILAFFGAILAWLPLLAPFFFGGMLLLRARVLRFDYLLPAELFPLALLGGGLLIWAALRARLYRRLICWSVGASVFFLLASQALAVITGLASGASEPTGAAWVLVVACLVLYILALLVTAVGGIFLLRHLFNPLPQPA